MPRMQPLVGVEKDHRKQSANFVLLAAVTVVSSLFSIACNTMAQTAAPSPAADRCDNCVPLQISPTDPSLTPGASLQFSATVRNTNETAVVWRASAGTISADGLFTAPTDTSAGPITITAASVANKAASSSTVVTLCKSKFAITVSNLKPAVVGKPYSAELTATGGQPPYRWNIVATSLPEGLLLNGNTGMLSGSPIRAGSFDFTVQATDAASRTIQASLPLVVNALGSTGEACGPPVYCSRTDVEIVQVPSRPPNVGNLAGANTIVTDPDFHNRIVRITDANTHDRTYFKNRSYMTAAGGSADENLWNLDSTLLVVQDTGSQVYPFSFNPTTMQASRMYTSSRPETGGLMIPTPGSWSRVNPNVFYTESGTAIQKYDFSDRDTPPSPQPVYDFVSSRKCLPAGFTVKWKSRGGVNADDTVFGMAFSNTGAQNTGVYAVAYKVGSGCSVLNTQTGRVWGDWGANGTIQRTERWTIHNAKLSKDGKWLVLAVGNYLTSPRPQEHGPFFWEIGTTNVISCGDGGFCGGHWTEGYTHWVNNNDTPISNLVIRSFAEAKSVDGLSHHPPAAKFSGFFDQHLSWNNVDPADSVPFLSTTWIPTATFTAPWYDEIIAVAADGSGRTWRFAHSFITGHSHNFSIKYGIGSVSQDGRFFAFSSDWMGTLGSHSGARGCTVGFDCRGDVFVVELK